MADMPPEWARSAAYNRLAKSCDDAGKARFCRDSIAVRELALMIAAYEEDQQVDSLLVEARKLVADRYDPRTGGEAIRATLAGEDDHTTPILDTLIALRRGMELARTEGEG